VKALLLCLNCALGLVLCGWVQIDAVLGLFGYQLFRVNPFLEDKPEDRLLEHHVWDQLCQSDQCGCHKASRLDTHGGTMNFYAHPFISLNQIITFVRTQQLSDMEYFCFISSLLVTASMSGRQNTLTKDYVLTHNLQLLYLYYLSAVSQLDTSRKCN
jgi:hypothetical protein